MICRMWHGRTLRTTADAYASFLVQRAIPDYRSVAGNLDVAVLRRDEGEVTHFLTVTHWESEESIRTFAGDDLLKAKYYPEDQQFLLEIRAHRAALRGHGECDRLSRRLTPAPERALH